MFYRKYRPQFFKDVVGQDIVVKILKNFLKENRIPHGYLFAGDRGTGKTSVARIYAKALNCLNLREGEPCGECNICKLFEANKFLDILELDAASNRKIEDIRNIKEHIGFRPIQGKYKVFIIDEAHSLTEEASNALLKTLEEPPPHAIFILATTDPDRILTTIHSRVQRIDFKKIGLPHIVTKLKYICDKEKIKYQEEALYLIAEESEGSLRDAETLLEKIVLGLNEGQELTDEFVNDFLGNVSFNKILLMLELINQKNIKDIFDLLFDVYFKGYDILFFVKNLLKTIRQLILLKIQPSYINHLSIEKDRNKLEKMKNLSDNFQLEDLKKLSYLLFEAEINIKKDPPVPILPLELALLEYFDVK